MPDGECDCGSPGENCTCGASQPAEEPRYVYALGAVELRFPSVAIQREYQHALRQIDTEGLTDRQALRAVLSARENRYLARQFCFVLSIQGLDTYILLYRDPTDLDLLVNTLRPEPNPSALDLVIGLRGPTAPAHLCNGLIVPILVFDQIYSFDREELVDAVPRPQTVDATNFKSAAEDLVDRIIHVPDNAGATDEHRALNYLIVRYPAIYAQVAEQYERDFALTGIDVRLAAPVGGRQIANVVLSFANRKTTLVEEVVIGVDVTGKFPYLAAAARRF